MYQVQCSLVHKRGEKEENCVRCIMHVHVGTPYLYTDKFQTHLLLTAMWLLQISTLLLTHWLVF